MNYLKLDDLDTNIKAKKIKYVTKEIFSELLRFSIFIVSISILIIVFINFNVFYYAFKEKVLSERSFASDITAQISGNESMKLNELVTPQSTSDAFENLQADKYMEVLESKLDLIKSDDDKTLYERDMNKYLKNKLKTYSFDFNLLPPDKRLTIEEIGVDAPIVDLSYASSDKLKNADYDEDLYKGVVKYPYTPDPGNTGAVLIFGHTSYYWWKKNPYGEVLSRMPMLHQGSKITLTWGGNSYEYEVLDKVVVQPNHVSAEYEKYKNDKYLILMGCYPIGTSAKRMLIIAKQVK